MASQSNVYSNVPSGGAKKETGVKIQTGLGYQKQNEKKPEASESPEKDQGEKKQDQEEEDEDCDLGALFWTYQQINFINPFVF